MFEPLRPVGYSQQNPYNSIGKKANSPNQLRFLGMEWIMIKDEDNKGLQPLYQRGLHNDGASSVKHASERKFNFHLSPMPKGSMTNRTRIPTIETERSVYEEELLDDARRIMGSDKTPKNYSGTKTIAVLYNDLDSSPKLRDAQESPMHNGDFQNFVKTVGNVSITTTDRIEERESHKNSTVKALVRMIESNAEYEDLFISKGKKPPPAVWTKQGNYRLTEDDEERIKNKKIAFSGNPRTFFVSPTGVVCSSTPNMKTEPDIVIQPSAKKELIEEKNIQPVEEKNIQAVEGASFSMVWDAGTSKGLVRRDRLNPEKLLTDNLDYELFIKSEKDKRKEVASENEMKSLLDAFASKPGKKTYESRFINEEKVRLEAQAFAKMSRFASSKYLKGFHAESTRKSSKKTEFPYLNSAKRKGNGEIGEEIEVAAEIREKSLAELLFDKFKAKLPEINQMKHLQKEKKSQNNKKPIDNPLNRRKNYDAWYLNPNMRAERLSAFIHSAEKF